MQSGPDFLQLPRPAWPLSRDFVPTLPVEERRKRDLEASILNVYNVFAAGNAFEDNLDKHVPGRGGIFSDSQKESACPRPQASVLSSQAMKF